MKARILLLLLSFLTFFFPHLQGASLHSIIFSDTKTEYMGYSFAADHKNLCEEVSRISKQAGLKLHEWHFTGRSKDPKKLLMALKNLQTQPDDVILFFFAGHGYHRQGDITPWPTLEFYLAKKSLKLSTVISLIQAKDARLKLIFSDCCNKIIADQYVSDLIEKSPRLSKIMKNNYEHLFLKAHGIVIATSCKVGQYSLSDTNGGVFTKALLSSLRHETKNYNRDATWENIFLQTDNLIEQELANSPVGQNAEYHVELYYSQ